MKMRKELAVFLGIVAGFTFLISLFAGLGLPNDTLIISATFFAVIAVSIGLLLLPKKAKRTLK